jgi:hypothetical protein
MKKLLSKADKELLAKLDILKKPLIIEEDSNGICIYRKFRYVNPEVVANGKMKVLSELLPEYGDLIEQEKKVFSAEGRVCYKIKEIGIVEANGK